MPGAQDLLLLQIRQQGAGRVQAATQKVRKAAETMNVQVQRGSIQSARGFGVLQPKLQGAGSAAAQAQGKFGALMPRLIGTNDQATRLGRNFGMMSNVFAETAFSVGQAIPGMRQLSTSMAIAGGSAFQLGGAFGVIPAAIGGIVAIAPQLISMFSDTEEQAEETKIGILELNDALDKNIQKAQERLEAARRQQRIDLGIEAERTARGRLNDAISKENDARKSVLDMMNKLNISGREMNELLAAAADESRSVKEAFAEQRDLGKQADVVLEQHKGTVGELVRRLIEYERTANTTKERQERLNEAMGRGQDEAKDLHSEYIRAARAAKEYVRSTRSLFLELKMTEQSMKNLPPTMQFLTGTTEQAKEAVKALGTQHNDAAKKAGNYETRQEKLNRLMSSGTPRTKALATALEAVSSAAGSADGSLLSLSDQMHDILSKDLKQLSMPDVDEARKRLTMGKATGPGVEGSEERRRRERQFKERQRQREKEREEQQKLVDKAREASQQFSSAWEKGNDAVMKSFAKARKAAKKAGTEMPSTMDAIGEHAKATGATIAKDFAGTISRGMGQAVMAMLAGEKSAKKAFKEIAKQAIQAVVKMAIVRAVFHAAAAIGSAATFQFQAAAQHAAAAAMYGAVAAVAAGVGYAAGGKSTFKQPDAQSGGGGGGDGGAQPTAAPPPDAGGGGGGQKTVVVNVNAPTEESRIGRTQKRANREADRVFGRRS